MEKSFQKFQEIVASFPPIILAVDAAPVAVVQSGKKAKRAAEDEIEKAVNTKKQKVQRDEVVVAQ
ncbi:hypothetical protein BVRB_7g160050 [Beta vulgaris subsp. vulgaris]|nr:hypothetical protein BVRB_7g160050 [Beta vulgaris subsp. vulgaris]